MWKHRRGSISFASEVRRALLAELSPPLSCMERCDTSEIIKRRFGVGRCSVWLRTIVTSVLLSGPLVSTWSVAQQVGTSYNLISLCVLSYLHQNGSSTRPGIFVCFPTQLEGYMKSNRDSVKTHSVKEWSNEEPNALLFFLSSFFALCNGPLFVLSFPSSLPAFGFSGTFSLTVFLFSLQLLFFGCF